MEIVNLEIVNQKIAKNSYRKFWKKPDTLIRIYENFLTCIAYDAIIILIKGATDRRLVQFMN